MLIHSRANTQPDEPAWFDVERETVEFGRGVVPPAEKRDVLLLVYEEDVGRAFVRYDLAPVSLHEQARGVSEWVDMNARKEDEQTSTSRVIWPRPCVTLLWKQNLTGTPSLTNSASPSSSSRQAGVMRAKEKQQSC